MHNRAAWLVVLVSLVSGRGASGEDLDALYKNRQWFQLREVVAHDPAVPPFYRAAVACAFNRGEECETGLLRFLDASPAAERCDARDLLAARYLLTGRYSLAAAQIEACVSECGREKGDPANTIALARAWGRHGDLSIVRAPQSSIRARYRNGFIRVELDGKPYDTFIDTGANFSVIAESAVRRLGLESVPVAGVTMSESSGKGVGVPYVVVVRKFNVGDIELANVGFIVVPDSAPPFRYWGKGKRCILGLQVLLACRTMRWKGRAPWAAVELGGPGLDGESNMAFDEMTPIVTGVVKGKTVLAVLDTGAGHTQFYPAFARDFPELTASRFDMRLEGVGGVATKPAARLPRVELELGGLQLVFSGGAVMLEGGSKHFHVLLGSDALFKMPGFAVDFITMRFSLKDR